MAENQIARSRRRLVRFLLDLLEPMGRSERRHWGELSVCGLLQDGERKSVCRTSYSYMCEIQYPFVWVLG